MLESKHVLSNIQKEIIIDGELELFKLSLNSESLIEKIKSSVSWRDDKVKIFGKEFSQPRKVAWYSEPDVSYTYSGIELTSPGIPEYLSELQKIVEKLSAQKFNSILINLYRDGSDYMGWHSDDESELGVNPVISSLSLGESRDFIFRNKDDHKQKIKLTLNDGDLLIMKGSLQHNWQHALPKRLKVNKERLNLTFRKILK